MLTWSKPNAIVPDEPSRWILTTLQFYAIVASVGIALAFAVISFLALALGALHHEGGGGTMVVMVAMLILFAVATYFTGRTPGFITAVLRGLGFID